LREVVEAKSLEESPEVRLHRGHCEVKFVGDLLIRGRPNDGVLFGERAAEGDEHARWAGESAG
jgi:hypothetical protein